MKLRTQIKESIYSPSFYKQLEGRPLSFSVRYFLKLILILSLLVTVISSILILPILVAFLFNTDKVVEEVFPDNLQIVIEDGSLSTNVEEPYFVPAMEEIGKSDFPFENFLVIDTTEGNILEKLDKYNTLALIAEDVIVYRQVNRGNFEQAQIVVNKIPKDTNLVLNQNNISEFLGSIEGYFKLVPPLLVIAIFVGLFIGLLVGSFILFLLISLIVWIFFSIFGDTREKGLSYAKWYQAVIHAGTLGVILMWFALLLNVSPLLVFTLITLVILFVNVYNIRHIDRARVVEVE